MPDTNLPRLDVQFDHWAISVPNLDESIAWYERIFDFKVLRRIHIPQIPANVAVLTRDGLNLEIFEVPNATPLDPARRNPDTDNRTHGHKHMSFRAHNIEALHEELVKRGVDIVWFKKFPHGTNIFLRDNAGCLIEVVEIRD